MDKVELSSSGKNMVKNTGLALSKHDTKQSDTLW
jgi:hypothetical protein